MRVQIEAGRQPIVCQGRCEEFPAAPCRLATARRATRFCWRGCHASHAGAHKLVRQRVREVAYGGIGPAHATRLPTKMRNEFQPG